MWGTRSTIVGSISTLVFLALSVAIMRTLIISPLENIQYHVCNVELNPYMCDGCTYLNYSLPLFDVPPKNGTIGSCLFQLYTSKCTMLHIQYISCYFDATARDISLQSYGFPVFGIWLFAAMCTFMLITGFATGLFCLIHPSLLKRPKTEQIPENESLIHENDEQL